jgi:taurine dioxygenase
MPESLSHASTRDPDFPLFAVERSGAAIGATAYIDDLKLLDARHAAELRRAWLKYQVIRIRGQQLDDAEQVAFGRWFGEFRITNPLPNPLTRADLTDGRPALRQEPRNDRFPQITVVSNVVKDGLALGGLGDGELSWHSDMCQFEAPPSATIVYGVEIPEGRGRTLFTSLTHAAEDLPADRLRSLSALSVKQDEVMDSAGYPRAGYPPITDVASSPGRAQPLVTRHPETGRPVLFLGRRLYAHVVGLPVSESETLLDSLWAHATQPKFQWAQEWLPGDVVIWDNRSVLHKRERFGADARRMLRRVVIQGDVPKPFVVEQTATAAVA